MSDIDHLKNTIEKHSGVKVAEVIVYTLVKDGEPYKDWTENGRTISVGEMVTIEYGPLAGQSGKILRFCSYRSDAEHVEVELSDGTKTLWPINAIVYKSKEDLNAKPGRWQLNVPGLTTITKAKYVKYEDLKWNPPKSSK